MIENKCLQGGFSLKEGLQARKMHKPVVWDTYGHLILSGNQGNGKSLTAVKIISDCLKAHPNLVIMSNIPLNGINYIPFSFDTFLALDSADTKGMICFIDEITNIFPCTDRVDSRYQYICNQMRKRELLLISTCPKYSRLAKVWRDSINLICLCKNYFGFIQWNHYYTQTNESFAIEEGSVDFVKSLKHVKRQIFTHSPSLYSLYDTRILVKKEDFE